MIAALSLDSSYLFMRYWPPVFIFISKCETSDNSSVSKFGSVFFTLTRGISLQSLLLRVLSLSFRFFSCSSVQSLLRPKKQGWSQKGASLWDKWSFHPDSPTLSNQRVPVKLISILIKVEILRAQRYRYVAVYRKRGNTITAEPPIVWLCSKQYDISHTHDERYDTHTINLKLNMKRCAWDMARID